MGIHLQMEITGPVCMAFSISRHVTSPAADSIVLRYRMEWIPPGLYGIVKVGRSIGWRDEQASGCATSFHDPRNRGQT